MMPPSKSCIPCRARKVKCDTGSPICGPCRRSRANLECSYDPTGPGPHPLPLRRAVRKSDAMALDLHVPPVHAPGYMPTVSMKTHLLTHQEKPPHHPLVPLSPQKLRTKYLVHQSRPAIQPIPENSARL
ncbi:hypothetical protein BDM02DRAFT_1494732 [Thelephora ganbajun]|uniref:Uncharacterized protein n=1 Tax=Thelephora ganbajun TaxID=370292 RepID=A0ACB6ZKY0_THEGA|nr:hypothetical protein BDM02DRAFT_1494732 [Thelephora ganbajun]